MKSIYTMTHRILIADDDPHIRQLLVFAFGKAGMDTIEAGDGEEALRLALSADGETHASVASYNNHWGVPLSLARWPESAKYAVFEIGMNHAGETVELAAIAQPWTLLAGGSNFVPDGLTSVGGYPGDDEQVRAFKADEIRAAEAAGFRTGRVLLGAEGL